MTVWNIMVQGHQNFVTVRNLSSKFVFVNKSNWKSECQGLWLRLVSDNWCLHSHRVCHLKLLQNFSEILRNACIFIWLHRCVGNQIFLRKLFFSNTGGKYSNVFIYCFIKYLQLHRIFVTSFIDFTANGNLRKKTKSYRQL